MDYCEILGVSQNSSPEEITKARNKMVKYKNLKKAQKGNQDTSWTIENIRDGFNYYFDLHGKYPTSLEVDLFEYLPSRRTLERFFGGIVEVRKTLQLETQSNYTTGEIRSKTAAEADKRAKIYEESFFNYLISKIPQTRVHEQKIIRPGNIAADFFIYNSDISGIVLDLFYAANLNSLSGVVNYKTKKYSNIQFPVFFILVGNDEITQELINSKIRNRKEVLPNHIKVLTEKNFKDNLEFFLSSKETVTNEICPICKDKYKTNDRKIKYHITYNPEVITFACQGCNYAEFLIRHPEISTTFFMDKRKETVRRWTLKNRALI